jgi:hypothetical protein
VLGEQQEISSMATFQELFDVCAFPTFEKQTRLSFLVGEQDWLLDPELATLTFGADIVFPVQFLGTESELTHTWLWADANTKAKLPAASLQLCRRARDKGCKLGLEEFQSDHFAFVEEVGKPTAHTLIMVTTCLAGASCYYRCPQENGAVFVALSDSRVDQQPGLDREGFIAAFNNLMWIPGDTKKRVVSYLSAKGYMGKDFAGTELKCKLYTGEEIGLSFKPASDGGMRIKFLAERKLKESAAK